MPDVFDPYRKWLGIEQLRSKIAAATLQTDGAGQGRGASPLAPPSTAIPPAVPQFEPEPPVSLALDSLDRLDQTAVCRPLCVVTHSDDDVRLWIDGQKVCDNWSGVGRVDSRRALLRSRKSL